MPADGDCLLDAEPDPLDSTTPANVATSRPPPTPFPAHQVIHPRLSTQSSISETGSTDSADTVTVAANKTETLPADKPDDLAPEKKPGPITFAIATFSFWIARLFRNFLSLGFW